MVHRIHILSLCLFSYLYTPLTSANDSFDIKAMNWLAGEWVGTGSNDGSDKIEGYARVYWTPASSGSIASTFTWHAPEQNHIHYAFTVYQQTEGTISGKGIHHGRDFETFEDEAWHFRALELRDGLARFECIQHCRTKTVSYTLLADGRLEGRWDPIDEAAPDWVTTYERVITTD